jgi:hypothetical protein
MFKYSRIFDKLLKRVFEVDEIREGSEVIAFNEDNKRKFFRGLRNPFYLKKKKYYIRSMYLQIKRYNLWSIKAFHTKQIANL